MKCSGYCVAQNLLSLWNRNSPCLIEYRRIPTKNDIDDERSNFENFVERERVFFIYISRMESLVCGRLTGGCIPCYEDTRGWFCREHLSYKRFQPIHTPHNVPDCIPNPILIWPFVLDIVPSIPLFRLQAILLKQLGRIISTANTNTALYKQMAAGSIQI